MASTSSTTRTWLEERFLSPVVVVCATEEADRQAGLNGLDVVQLLRPFSVYPDNLFARIGEKNEVSVVRQFGVRLIRPECVREMDPRSRSEHFISLMSEVSEAEFAFGEQLDVALDAVLKQPSVVDPCIDGSNASILLQRSFTPWLSQFVVDYVSMVRCSYFDALDHPVAHLIVVASNADAKVMLDDVKEQEKRTRPCREHMPCMDEEVLTHVIVLHDMIRGPPLERVIQAFGALQNQYTAQRCALLRINSVPNPEEQKPMDCSKWIAANPAVESIATNGTGVKFSRVAFSFGEWPNARRPMITGCYLTPGNVDELQSVMNQFMSMALFPHLDRKLRALVASINEKRQTTLSKVAAWFRKEDTKPKAECFVLSNDPQQPSKYLFSALEMQMRRAGDLCLAFRDYEAAQGYYRMCRQELQSTISQREFNRYLIAGCQEGIALCQYFQGKLPLPTVGRGGPECRLETARDEYQRNSVHSYAFRSTLMMFLICRSKTPPVNDRALALLQQVLKAGVVSSNKAYAAVIYELCATTCLFLNPPIPVQSGPCSSGTDGPPVTVQDEFPVKCRLRHYARYMTLAAQSYLELQQYEMSLRCALRALRVCSGRSLPPTNVPSHGKTTSPAIGGGSDPLVVGGVGSNTTASRSRSAMHEHLFHLVGHLYSRLSKPMQALRYTTVPIVDGVSPSSTSFMVYWRRLRQLLDEHKVSVCPHMPLPVMNAQSVHIQHSRCFADPVTQAEESQLPIDTAEKEWKVLEEGLRSHYHERTSCTVPKYYADGGQGRKGSASTTRTKSISIPVQERVLILVEFRNPMQCPIVVDSMGFLIVAPNTTTSTPGSSHSKRAFEDFASTVPAAGSFSLPPLTTTRLMLPFSPQQEGEHVIVGLRWNVDGIDGVLHFAKTAPSQTETKPAQTAGAAAAAAAESLMEAALRGITPSSWNDSILPSPSPGEYLRVTATMPQAKLEVTLDPSLPDAMRDGQLYRGMLKLTNVSSVAATHVTVQRSPANAHLMYFTDFSLTENESQLERPLLVAAPIEPSETRCIPVVIRAQFGEAALGSAGRNTTRTINNIALLIGYAPHDTRGGGFAVTPTTATSPLVATPASPVASSPFSQHVRCTRLLRRFTVRSLMSLHVSVSAALTPNQRPGALVSVVAYNTSSKTSQEPPARLCRCIVSVPRATQRVALLAPLIHGDADDDTTSTAATALLLSGDQGFSLAFRVEDDASSKHMDPVCTSPSMDTELLSLSEAVPSVAKAKLTESIVGKHFAGDSASIYFSARSAVGSGSLGEYQQRDAGEFSFYLDRAGGKSAEELEEERRLKEEIAAFGRPAVSFPPLVVAVGWCVDDEDGTVVAGQQYAFVDVLPKLGRAISLATSPVTDVIAAYRGCRSCVPSRGVVAFTPTRLPAVAINTTSCSVAAVATFDVLFHSWCALPVRVEMTVKAPTASTPSELAQRSSAAAPPGFVSFVGVTKRRFILLPNESHTVQVTAHMYTTGIVNLNALEVNVSPVPFVDGMTTGSAPPVGGFVSTDHAAQKYLSSLVVLGNEVPWMLHVRMPVPCAFDQAMVQKETPATVTIGPGQGLVAVHRTRGMSILHHHGMVSPIAPRNSMRNSTTAGQATLAMSTSAVVVNDHPSPSAEAASPSVHPPEGGTVRISDQAVVPFSFDPFSDLADSEEPADVDPSSPPQPDNEDEAARSADQNMVPMIQGESADSSRETTRASEQNSTVAHPSDDVALTAPGGGNQQQLQQQQQPHRPVSNASFQLSANASFIPDVEESLATGVVAGSSGGDLAAMAAEDSSPSSSSSGSFASPCREGDGTVTKTSQEEKNADEHPLAAA